MPRNPEAIPVAANGDVYVAEYSTGLVIPSNATAAPDSAFNAVGYISEEGVTFGVETETGEIPAWQSLQPVRRMVTGQNITAQFQLMEWTSVNLSLAFGGGTFTDNLDGTWSFTLPSADERKEYAIVIDALDGNMRYRIVLPRITVDELGDITFRSGEAAALDVTVSALPDVTGEALYLYGSDGAFEESP